MKQSFSAVLDSKNQVKNITITEDKHQKVFLEAYIGQLMEIKFTEGLLLEIIGSEGILRIDLPLEALVKAVSKAQK